METPERTYTVTGMSCGHCVRAVADALSALPGVSAVAVDLAAGTAAVTGDADEAAVRAALDEAGYAVAP